ncbi:hypothetical protein Pst134EB_031109 [Puccinia striiformis f. sp. tritici]|nr:hypothetical protein Pst134EB_031109 [Puccinia striiformis f. sp. tritici]
MTDRVVNSLEDWRLKKGALQNHSKSRNEMVIDARIPETESEFWDGREESLYHDARLDAQKIETSAQMVDPRPETTDNDEIRMSITPQMLRDFFRPISGCSKSLQSERSTGK